MKKISYLMGLIAVVALASCNPMTNTYKTLDANPTPGTVTYTLQSSDYALLKASDATAASTLGFTTTDQANTDISYLLNYKYYKYANGSSATVTYNAPIVFSYVKPADSVLKDVAYTLTNADYLLLPGNKYYDFSVAQLLTWLPYKYTTPVANQLAVLTWVIYPTTTLPAPPYSFMYLNGTWTQLYQLTAAQYASVGHGTYNEFTSTDTQAAIVAYLNAILKADLSISATAKIGDIKYVSYYYYVSSTAAYQRVQKLIYNGTNWVTTTVPVTAIGTFSKTAGTWQPQPIVSYTLTTADNTLIANGAAGTTAAKTNLATYGDFSSAWSTSDMDAAVIECLLVDFPNPQTGTLYKVTFANYSSPAPNPLSFTWSGTAWVAQQ